MKVDISCYPVLQEIGRCADELGIEAYVVGGFVRDLLLGRPIKNDIDLVVVGDGVYFASAVASRYGKRTVYTYPRFGTAAVSWDSLVLEFVGARRERYTLSESRNPEISPGSLYDDLARRDFTVNAIAISLNKSSEGEIIDPFGGIDDLNKGILRTPVDPETTFNDDPLRQLRAVRFATTLDFDIAPEAAEAIKRYGERLQIISQERITAEIEKLLASARPSKGLFLLRDLGLLEWTLPELVGLVDLPQASRYHSEDGYTHTCYVVQGVANKDNKNIWIRWAALLHDIGKPQVKEWRQDKGWVFVGHEKVGADMVEKVYERMRLSKQHLEKVERLVRNHMTLLRIASDSYGQAALRRLIINNGDILDPLYILARSDLEGSFPPPDGVNKEKMIADLDRLYMKLVEMQSQEHLQRDYCPIGGREIMELFGIPPGKEVGRLKRLVVEAIIQGEIPNTREAAIDLLLRIRSQDNNLSKAKNGSSQI